MVCVPLEPQATLVPEASATKGPVESMRLLMLYRLAFATPNSNERKTFYELLP